jgi:hypothetical protein
MRMTSFARKAHCPLAGRILAGMTEAELQSDIRALYRKLQLVCLHLRSPAREGETWIGWPDLLIIKPGGALLFRELKAPGKDLCAVQKHWREILAGQDYGVWKPADWHPGRIRGELEALAGQQLGEPEDDSPEARMWRALLRAAAH